MRRAWGGLGGGVTQERAGIRGRLVASRDSERLGATRSRGLRLAPFGARPCSAPRPTMARAESGPGSPAGSASGPVAGCGSPRELPARCAEGGAGRLGGF